MLAIEMPLALYIPTLHSSWVVSANYTTNKEWRDDQGAKMCK